MGQIRHKLDLFLELEGLFRGKKFVEYVAGIIWNMYPGKRMRS